MFRKLLSVSVPLFALVVVFVVVIVFVLSVKIVAPGSVLSSGNKEADVEIAKFWDTAITRCGDTWYAKEWLNVIEAYQFYQFKNPVMMSMKLPLYETDKEANIQWMGNTFLQSSNYRIYKPPAYSFKGGWSKWHRGTPPYGIYNGLNVLVMLKNDQWEFYNSSMLGHGWYSMRTLYGVDCNEVPK